MAVGKVNIIIYKITGRQLFFNVPSRICEECDLTVGLTNKIVSEINDKNNNNNNNAKNKIKIEVKPWLSNFISAVAKGALHPPIVLINGHIFSQGRVPNHNELKRKILQELENK
jgi:hypothetical protein